MTPFKRRRWPTDTTVMLNQPRPETSAGPTTPADQAPVNAAPAVTVGGGPTDAYLRTRVMTAKPEELRLMLLDGAIKFARQGREGLENKDYEASFNGISQSRDIVLELITGIAPNTEDALASRVRGLYTFMYNEMVTASFARDAARLSKVIELLEYERETWALFIERLRAEQAAGGPSADATAPPAPHPMPIPAPAPIPAPTGDAPRTSLSLEA